MQRLTAKERRKARQRLLKVQRRSNVLDAAEEAKWGNVTNFLVTKNSSVAMRMGRKNERKFARAYSSLQRTGAPRYELLYARGLRQKETREAEQAEIAVQVSAA